MAETPILLFLHGINVNEEHEPWRDGLDAALRRLGYPGLDAVNVIAPKYPHSLGGVDDDLPIPPRTIDQPGGAAAKAHRRDFERRAAALELRLGMHDGGAGSPIGEAVAGAALGLPPFEQARNYLTQPRVRAKVLRRVIDAAPRSGRLVIVGHSLGSVIAADVIRRLPPQLRVVGLVTIGSPLAGDGFDIDALRRELKDPPANLGWWVNFWNVNDTVVANRGVSAVFPWLVDRRISRGVFPHSHLAKSYVTTDVVAEAIGYALFGSLSRELSPTENGVDLAADSVESLALLALRFAHLVRAQLTDERGERFADAIRRVQATAVDEIRTRNAALGRALPTALARLAFDLSDPEAVVPEPPPAAHIAGDEAVLPLIVLATENVVRPFEIVVPKSALTIALGELTAEMGLGTRYGTDALDAVKRAQEALRDGQLVPRVIKWSAIGVGAAALLAATGGLLLAAAPGLVGAAAITSALAAFGPGGMIGGLLTAGTLVGAGTGGIALGLASPGTSAEAVEAVITRQLATVILRHSRGLEMDGSVWAALAETEVELRRQLERVDEISDPDSASVKELKRKLQAVERALVYMRKNGLEPSEHER